MENSPLNKLSAELRNTIAEMALYQERVITVNDQLGNGRQGGRKENQIFHHDNALTQTCKEMKKNYTKMFFSINNFAFEVRDQHFLRNIERFPAIIGQENFQAVKSVEITQDTFSSLIEIGKVIWRALLSSTHVPISRLRLKISLSGGTVRTDYREFWIRQDDPRQSLREAVLSTKDELATCSPYTGRHKELTMYVLHPLQWALMRVRKRGVDI